MTDTIKSVITRERIKELEAKCYFEWGLGSEDEEELDELISPQNKYRVSVEEVY